MIVVNPNSGPGDEPLPSRDYMREVPKLNAFPNVTTVGYIAITWTRKSLDDVKKEIDQYAGWEKKALEDYETEGLYVEGIYLDETPNHVSDNAKSYLKDLTEYIKGLEGLRGERLVSLLFSQSFLFFLVYFGLILIFISSHFGFYCQGFISLSIMTSKG